MLTKKNLLHLSRLLRRADAVGIQETMRFNALGERRHAAYIEDGTDGMQTAAKEELRLLESGCLTFLSKVLGKDAAQLSKLVDLQHVIAALMAEVWLGHGVGMFEAWRKLQRASFESFLSSFPSLFAFFLSFPRRFIHTMAVHPRYMCIPRRFICITC